MFWRTLKPILILKNTSEHIWNYKRRLVPSSMSLIFLISGHIKGLERWIEKWNYSYFGLAILDESLKLHGGLELDSSAHVLHNFPFKKFRISNTLSSDQVLISDLDYFSRYPTICF